MIKYYEQLLECIKKLHSNTTEKITSSKCKTISFGNCNKIFWQKLYCCEQKEYYCLIWKGETVFSKTPQNIYDIIKNEIIN